MPPRYAYWTILVDGAPTAFRAREREELLPTLHQLQRKNPNVALQWFARGRLWESREAEHEDFQRRKRSAEAPHGKPPAGGERRNADWRPGGAHKDPRDRFKKRNRPERAWTDTVESRTSNVERRPKVEGRPPRENKPWSDEVKSPKSNVEGRPPRENKPWERKPGPPSGDRPWSNKPPTDRPRSDRPWSNKPPSDRPRSDRPWSNKPPTDRPRSDRPGSNKPPTDRPRSDRPWSNKPPSDRPRGDRPWDRKPGGRDRDDRPWGAKPPRDDQRREKPPGPDRPPRGDKPWQDRKA